jgi:hypothetical protein
MKIVDDLTHDWIMQTSMVNQARWWIGAAAARCRRASVCDEQRSNPMLLVLRRIRARRVEKFQPLELLEAVDDITASAGAVAMGNDRAMARPIAAEGSSKLTAGVVAIRS